jgi:molybdopterin converting factor small subunit
LKKIWKKMAHQEQNKESQGIRVLAFGILAEKMNTGEITVPAVHTVSDLQKKIEELYPLVSGIRYSIAVDRKLANADTNISSDSEIALLPPFSGG